VDGRTYSLKDVRGTKGTLVVFICNHCPFVKATIGRLVEEVAALKALGIGVIGIMPNDTKLSPGDSFDNMKAFAKEHRLNFPYVIDGDPGGCARLRGGVHARFLRLQCEGRTAISRAAR
jgi:peroxiredoxin